MPGSSVFFYGRRSRSSRTFHDLTSSSSPSSASASASASASSSAASDSNASSHGHHHRNRHRNADDPHRRHRHANLDVTDHLRPPSVLPLPEREPQQRGCNGESSLQDITDRETVRDLNRRYSRNNRLPGPVLLAKERLLQRLRGVSVSGARQSREASPSFHCNDFWVVDADWETSGFREPPTANPMFTEIPAEAHQLSPEEPKKKPLGLTKETLSQLHHEVFTEHEKASIHLKSKATHECSICLENFVEGNELTSLPCGHRFHTSCLCPWLQSCGDCPYCRSCIMLAS